MIGSFLEIPSGYVGCSTSTVGSCTISSCAAAADGGSPPDGGQVSAGALTLTGLADGGLTLMPGTGGYQQVIMGAVFVPGAQLGVSAAGATVPAFTAQVTAPTAVTVTAPVCPQSMCPAISKAAGLSVAWTGGVGTVSVQVLAGTDQISCEYPAAAGSAMIPSSVISMLPNGQASLFFNTLNATTIQAGQFPVKVTASEAKIFQSSIAP